ncbi:MAG: hypothetical protein EOP10_09880 [Proteobacteria bacterium]|nr:MAG: hypothetical protein EOP10_09880 [Pseudomonadota bacterium]
MLQTNLKRIIALSLTSLLAYGVSSCKTEEKLPDLADKLAGAVDVVTAPSGNYIYALNSDYERRYDKGSILIINPDAPEGSQKVKAISVPRMGRSMSIAQNLMIITYADPEAKEAGRLQIWDLSSELEPQIVAEMDVGCQPLNAVLAPSSPYFTVSCKGGWILMGKNPHNTADARVTLDLVRGYEWDRRALYFYETGGKTYLFGFPTDLEALDAADQNLEDSKTYVAADDTITDGPNGVPDGFELTEAARRRTILASPYQMFIYPVSDEEAASQGPQDPIIPAFNTFRFIAAGTYRKPSQSNTELKFINFTLLEANGQPSAAEQITTPTLHRYRTNFWEAKTGPEQNPAIIYLSQRGDYGSESNNVVRMLLSDAGLANVATVKFEDLFTVSRVYGFAIDRDNGGRYPGDFEFATIGGEPMLFVNSFRDLIYFGNAPFYSVTRKLLEAPAVTQDVPSSFDSTGFGASFYQLAVSKSGKVLTSSYYGNVLYLFDGSPGVSIKDQTPIRIP